MRASSVRANSSAARPEANTLVPVSSRSPTRNSGTFRPTVTSEHRPWSLATGGCALGWPAALPMWSGARCRALSLTTDAGKHYARHRPADNLCHL